ncbi:hypothetical protein CIPAW_12G125300 [Carya illinoinensis]|uniref:Uncharacterized protein n=1 Tax=Carya illinoinensis TaxID=32201 RepID=A0A8T1NSD6_CARIL|nr:hypothetical protein CIPAW_12G125300 [Carya illinoinensis]
MSLPVSALLSAQTHNSNSVVKRPAANYRPSLWGDRFLSFANNSLETYENLEQAQKLKEEVQRMLMAPIDKPSQKLDEIDSVLQQIYKYYHYNEDELEISGHGLYTVALLFRLLRQQGYNIPSDVFNKFKDSKGKFRESLIDDVVHGEDILDEALDFTTACLESMVTADSNPSIAVQVSRALQRPLRKCLPRLEARHYLSIYQESGSFNEVLLSFAKLDFNILQRQHQKELVYLSWWWKGLNISTELSFARDRVVELYCWILGENTKTICMILIIDDAFDAYGTFEELELFTDTVKRWDINCIDQLPQYMKLIYKALLDVYEEIEEEMSKEGRLYRVNYAKEALEQERGHIVSGSECYMKQHGVSKQEAHEEFQRQIVNAWKDMNEEFLKPTQVPTPLLVWILNLARVMDFLYKNEDAYTHLGGVLIEGVTSLLIDPLLL